MFDFIYVFKFFQSRKLIKEGLVTKIMAVRKTNKNKQTLNINTNKQTLNINTNTKQT